MAQVLIVLKIFFMTLNKKKNNNQIVFLLTLSKRVNKIYKGKKSMHAKIDLGDLNRIITTRIEIFWTRFGSSSS